MGVRVVTDSACDLPDDLIERSWASRSSRSRSASATRSSSTGWSSAPTSSGAGSRPRTCSPRRRRRRRARSRPRFRRPRSRRARPASSASTSPRALSATMQSAQVAAQAVQADCPVEVVDSLMVSMGLGQPVPHRRAASRGRRLARVDRRQRRRTGATAPRLFGALDTLEYLKKGGRIGNAQALLGSMLSIKPVIEVRDGVVEEAGQGPHPVEGAASCSPTRSRSDGPSSTLCGARRQAPDIDELLELLEPTVARATRSSSARSARSSAPTPVPASSASRSRSAADVPSPPQWPSPSGVKRARETSD